MRCRPSELFAEEDELAAFCLDRAVTLFGRTLENELESITDTGKKGEAKRDRLLRKWIPEKKASTSGFRDPAKG